MINCNNRDRVTLKATSDECYELEHIMATKVSTRISDLYERSLFGRLPELLVLLQADYSSYITGVNSDPPFRAQYLQ
uniref:Uncharacterized protein n=1 Tax=Glossina pallidipes TaxID=7398 RepID=A0A1A9ZPM8_GLOPL